MVHFYCNKDKPTFKKFKTFPQAAEYAQDMARRYERIAQVRVYDTDEVIYSVDPKINLDTELRI